MQKNHRGIRLESLHTNSEAFVSSYENEIKTFLFELGTSCN